MSLYGPTFHVTPVDVCIIFQCNLYISCIMSCGNKIVQIVCFRTLPACSATRAVTREGCFQWLAGVDDRVTVTLFYHWPMGSNSEDKGKISSSLIWNSH